MHDPLTLLLHDGIIDEVIGRLKSGKEAELWLVRHGAEAVAAKVYKARQERGFRNDAAYREGRRVRDTRTQRAMERGSRFGQAAAEEAWKTREADVLHTLHHAGVRVPRPVMFYEGVLLMELVVDHAGHPAPRLVDTHLQRGEAAPLYADLRAQMIRMLCCDLVHGDLSPYNVLLGAHGPVIIDFPQVVGAAHNSQAARFFERDLHNLSRFLAALDPALRAAAGDASEIWRAYVRRELTPDFVPTGRPPPAPRGHRGPARPDRGGADRPQARHGGPPHHAALPHHGARGAQRGGSPGLRGAPQPGAAPAAAAHTGAAHAGAAHTAAHPHTAGAQPPTAPHHRRRRRRRRRGPRQP